MRRREKLKIKKAIEKGNMDGARIYAENAIHLRLASRLDAVVARLNAQAKMATITKSMTNIVKSLESSPQGLGEIADAMFQQVSGFSSRYIEAMQYASPQALWNALVGTKSPSFTQNQGEGRVQQFMDYIADLGSKKIGNLQKMSETMDSFEQQFVNMEVQAEFMENTMAEEKVDEDDLSRRLAELKARE
ncbi:unnamed protein product [Eruca vesicaria subsp. sativa]|uniref:Uncharacterized protein n=1 Tax=Eruca vesicaria subsp. sativa TaxID=29727 RepID=A0ABC8LR89_ERUVS|nr:unnamed protein product [Eruca vesicaria subsp. sativa]